MGKSPKAAALVDMRVIFCDDSLDQTPQAATR